MTAATAAQHTPSELALVSCDDLTGIVEFAARSRHDATRVNTVGLDTTTGEILCDCQGAECGRRCWHMDLVVAAWERTHAAHVARMLAPVALYNEGSKAAAMIAVDRRRGGRPCPADIITLVAVRYEWRRRAASAAAEAVAA